MKNQNDKISRQTTLVEYFPVVHFLITKNQGFEKLWGGKKRMDQNSQNPKKSFCLFPQKYIFPMGEKYKSVPQYLRI